VGPVTVKLLEDPISLFASNMLMTLFDVLDTNTRLLMPVGGAVVALLLAVEFEPQPAKMLIRHRLMNASRTYFFPHISRLMTLPLL